jgi:predicted transcriptional regulator
MVPNVARKPSSGLTEAEHRIMSVLWDVQKASVVEVVDRLEGEPRPAYNSVLTILRILERKGYVRHEKQGRAFIYTPVVNLGEARRGALGQLLSRFFKGSREQLVMDLLGHEDVDPDRLEEIRALLADVSEVGSRPRRSRR